MTVFKGYAIGLELPFEIEDTVKAFREALDPAIKGDTPFEQNQLPHITMARDIHENDLSDAYAYLNNALPIEIEFGEVERLPSINYDVLVKTVVTPTLNILHDALCSHFSLSLPYDFKAHITLAFINPRCNVDLRGIDNTLELPSCFCVEELLAFDPNGTLLIKDVCNECGKIDLEWNMLGCDECTHVTCRECIKKGRRCACDQFELF